MLYALGHLPSFLVLLGSFVVGVTLHGWVQAWTASAMGDRRPRLERRTSSNPRYHVDPFGAVGGLIGGLGWTVPVELLGRRQRTRTVAVALAGPASNILLGLGLLLAWRATAGGGPAQALAQAFGTQGAGYWLQHGIDMSSAAGGLALLLSGASQLYLGVLSLIPVPPLDGGRLLLALAPTTHGWQRARYVLVDQNIGVVALLVLLVLPLGGQLLLLQVLDSVLAPLLTVVLGA